jgi:hypothetical protein
VRDLYRGIRDFKNGCQPRTTIGKDEKGDLVIDCYSIVAGRRNQFSQQFFAYAVVLYECETWSLTLKEERRLRVFDNRVLRRMFGPKRDEVTRNGENYIMRS